MPSVLAVLGVPGETDRVGLGLAGIDRVCVLLVDGMGADLLAAHPDEAPFLTGAASRTLTAGFPSTTAASLGSLGTGVPPGEHGVVGYLLAVPGQKRLMNPLKWRLHGQGPHVDLLKEVVPEEFQPGPTIFERAVDAGIAVTRVCPPYQAQSGLTRAALRGGNFRPNFSMGDLVDGAAKAMREGSKSLVYAYHGELDLTGHARGPNSDAWALELAQVDSMARLLADRLPPDGALIVTADHGMVEIVEPVDFDSESVLQHGVARLGGEPRARHAYTTDGATHDVVQAWRSELGNEFMVVSRDDAVSRGWFGPSVTTRSADRIGDVIAVPTGSSAVIRSGAEPLQSRMIGHHGSLTQAEMLVPLRVVT
ncbi:alkaline phosphatase family protein [Antrihabitans cavernicola]|uniref:Alkaline phosphatase family protein n=2 Tax=Antrihabitans cavernicola TaxID=2495913 RepID=A0A5A7SEW6_9NOCA|nr:alkaline phosphatase family protein [Spelaeibacter cavernicola]